MTTPRRERPAERQSNMKSYYAQQSPRGFANEVIAHKFPSRVARDKWVDEHRNDGDCNSAACGARACTAKDARQIVGYKGNAVTESYNGMVDHTANDCPPSS